MSEQPVTAAMVESVALETADTAGESATPEAATGAAGAAAETAGEDDLEGAAAATELAGSNEPRIPLSRHKAILANARKRAEEEGRKAAQPEWEKTFRASWGLGEDVDANAVRQMMDARRWMTEDPRGYAQFVASQVLGPDWQQGARGAPSTAEAKAEAQAIEAKLKAETGEAVYTADQIQTLLAQERERWKAEVLGEVRPVLESHAQQRLQRAAEAEASQILTAYRQKPYFTELEPKIRAWWAQHRDVSLPEAYATVMSQELPAVLAEKAKAAESATGLARKAVATGTGAGRAVPAAGAADHTKRPILDVVRETARELGGR